MSMKIKLPNEQYAIVSDDDFKWLNQFKWYKTKQGYVVRNYWVNGKCKRVQMHRLVNNTPKELFTDHINRNRLDNRRSNLRSVTMSQNKHNAKEYSTNTSGYKGVKWNSHYKKWNSFIYVQYNYYNLGYYESKKDAAESRTMVERQLDLFR